MNRLGLILSFVLLLTTAFSVNAADIAVTDTLVFSVDVKDGWTLHLNDPPEELVKEIASHIAHEPAAAEASDEQINRVARKRLLANEAIIYHAASGSHLDIDFSPLDKGEKAPSARTLENSAKAAAESLASESDIEDVDWSVKPVEISGVDNTYLLSASYLQHHEPMTFRGYVGFVADSWFFLYFTSPGKDSTALAEMDEMLSNASVRLAAE